MTQKPRKSDFGEKKKKKKDIHEVHASDPPRSLRLRRSFWKTVSIYPRSAPEQSAEIRVAPTINSTVVTSTQASLVGCGILGINQETMVVWSFKLIMRPLCPWTKPDTRTKAQTKVFICFGSFWSNEKVGINVRKEGIRTGPLILSVPSIFFPNRSACGAK